MPNFDIVGLPDTAVKEARERVRSAIKNNGYPFPVGRITVNLAPANLRKSGTIYDLPICVGHPGRQRAADLVGPPLRFCGGALPVGHPAPCGGDAPHGPGPPGMREFSVCSSPLTAPRRPPWPMGLTVYPVETVEQLAAHLTGQSPITPAPPWSGAPGCPSTS